MSADRHPTDPKEHRTCSYCGAVFKGALPKPVHPLTAWVNIKCPNCASMFGVKTGKPQ